MASEDKKSQEEQEMFVEDGNTGATNEQEATPSDEMKNQEDSEQPESTIEDELKAAQDKYLRLYSDFDNFRKRTQKEKAELINYASAELLKEFLSLTDDFDRAIAANEKNDDSLSLKEGFHLLRHKLDTMLKNKEVSEMDCLDQDFNPDLHEAITNIPAGEDKKGKIIDVVQKGYFLKDKVLRYAKVVVGQ